MQKIQATNGHNSSYAFILMMLSTLYEAGCATAVCARHIALKQRGEKQVQISLWFQHKLKAKHDKK